MLHTKCKALCLSAFSACYLHSFQGQGSTTPAMYFLCLEGSRGRYKNSITASVSGAPIQSHTCVCVVFQHSQNTGCRLWWNFVSTRGNLSVKTGTDSVCFSGTDGQAKHSLYRVSLTSGCFCTDRWIVSGDRVLTLTLE